MKKLLLSAVLIFSGLTGFTALAQTQDSKLVKCEQTDSNGKAGKCKKGKDRKCHRHGDKHKHRHGARPDFFEGIDLTPDQQTALSNLRSERRQDAQKQREAKSEEFKNKVKVILTPEQYAQFEQNYTTIIQNRSKDGNKGRSAKDRSNDNAKRSADRKADRK